MAKQIPGKCFRCGKDIELGYTLCMTCAYALRKEKPRSITDQFEDIKQAICDNYCKYPHSIDKEEELWEICENCVLGRL